MNARKRRRDLQPAPASQPAADHGTELHDPFELLIAVILSAQATDKGVNLATGAVQPRPTPRRAILALGEED
jgi:endonuclease III